MNKIMVRYVNYKKRQARRREVITRILVIAFAIFLSIKW